MTIDRQHLVCLLDEDWNHDHISIASIATNRSGHFNNAQVNNQENVNSMIIFLKVRAIFNCNELTQDGYAPRKIQPSSPE